MFPQLRLIQRLYFLGDLSDGAETVSVAENSANGTAVIDVNANDGDGGATDTSLTYSITSGNTDSDKDGNLAFAIDASTGAISVNDSGDLDFEDGTTAYTLTVRADDGGASNNTTDAIVTVNISDVGTGDSYDFEAIANMMAPAFTASSQTFTLTGNMVGQKVDNYGSNQIGEIGNSNGYMDSGFQESRSGNVGGIAAPTGYAFKAQMIDVWPSSDEGGNVMSVGQTITVIGKLRGTQVISADVTTFAYGQNPDTVGGAWQRIDLTGTDFLTTEIDTIEFVLSGSMNYLSVDNFVYDELAVSNANPTLTTISNITGGTEDTEKEISFSDLTSAGNEADSDGTVTGFVVKAVSTGTLKIGATAGTATAWAAGSNDTIDASNKAFWTPASNANDASGLNAFTVVAEDNAGAESASAVQVVVETAAVNDAPVPTAGTSLTAIDEDVVSKDVEDVDGPVDPPNWGDDIADLVAAGGHSDADGHVISAIAIAGDASDPVTEGKWQYSTDPLYRVLARYRYGVDQCRIGPPYRINLYALCTGC